jgi:hypothetical protein
MTDVIIIWTIIGSIVVCIYCACRMPMIEGMQSSSGEEDNSVEPSDISEAEYQEYSSDDPMILSRKNAGNIEYLKDQVKDIVGEKPTINQLQENVKLMQTQIDAIVQQQADFGTQLAGDEPADITGTSSTESEEALP